MTRNSKHYKFPEDPATLIPSFPHAKRGQVTAEVQVLEVDVELVEVEVEVVVVVDVEVLEVVAAGKCSLVHLSL